MARFANNRRAVSTNASKFVSQARMPLDRFRMIMGDLYQICKFVKTLVGSFAVFRSVWELWKNFNASQVHLALYVSEVLY